MGFFAYYLYDLDRSNSLNEVSVHNKRVEEEKTETMNNELYINFDEYIRQGEPQKRERAEAWRVSIGL